MDLRKPCFCECGFHRTLHKYDAFNTDAKGIYSNTNGNSCMHIKHVLFRTLKSSIYLVSLGFKNTHLHVFVLPNNLDLINCVLPNSTARHSTFKGHYEG